MGVDGKACNLWTRESRRRRQRACGPRSCNHDGRHDGRKPLDELSEWRMLGLRRNRRGVKLCSQPLDQLLFLCRGEVFQASCGAQQRTTVLAESGMLDQLRRFEFWPVPRCQFMPVDVVSLGTIRARGRAFGSHNRDTVNQEPVLPDLLAAIEAGANMKLRCAQFLTRKLRSNRPCFGARGHERVQLVVVDVFSQRAYQG